MYHSANSRNHRRRGTTAKIAPRIHTVRRLLELYRSRNRANWTHQIDRQYRYAVAKLERYLGRLARVTDLNDATISGLLADLATDHAPRSVANCRAYILALWRFANRRGIVPVGPDIPQIPIPDNEPNAFTAEEVSRLLAAAAARPDGLAWQCRIRIAYETGERIGAIRALTVGDVDFESGLIYARAEIRKRRSRGMTHHPTATTVELLRQLAGDRPAGARLFPDLPTWQIYREFDQIAAAAKLPRGRRWKFHALRRSFASYVARESGIAAAQEALDHASMVNTRKYIAPRIVGRNNPTRHLPPV